MQKEQGLGEILVIAGGPVQKESIPELKYLGISVVFPTGSSLKALAEYSRKNKPTK